MLKLPTEAPVADRTKTSLFIGRREFTNYAAEVERFEALAATRHELAGTAEPVKHVWFFVPLREGAWRAAYRVFAREGRPVVAEMRLYPLEAQLPGLRQAEWSAEALGEDAHVPPGGITAALLAEAQPGRHVNDELANFLRELTAGLTERPTELAPEVQALFELLFGPRGFRPEEKPRLPRRGPKGWTDREYAELAADYLECHRGGSRSPARETAEAHDMTPVAFRAALRRARKKDVFRPSAPGTAGGQLTDYGESLLGGAEKPEPRKTKRMVRPR